MPEKDLTKDLIVNQQVFLQQIIKHAGDGKAIILYAPYNEIYYSTRGPNGTNINFRLPFGDTDFDVPQDLLDELASVMDKFHEQDIPVYLGITTSMIRIANKGSKDCAEAARKLNVTRQTFYGWRDRLGLAKE